MFKSTKVLAVMVMGAFIPGLRRKYPLHEYLSAVLLVIGLIFFTLADANSSPNFSIIGVVMVSGALITDAFLGNLQEAIFTVNPETTQMLFCSTVMGMPFLIPPMILTGELFTAWSSCSQKPWQLLSAKFPYFSLIALFGDTNTTTVTTARKAVAIVMKMVPDNRQAGRSLSADFKIQKESYVEVLRAEFEKLK